MCSILCYCFASAMRLERGWYEKGSARKQPTPPTSELFAKPYDNRGLGKSFVGTIPGIIPFRCGIIAAPIPSFPSCDRDSCSLLLGYVTRATSSIPSLENHRGRVRESPLKFVHRSLQLTEVCRCTRFPHFVAPSALFLQGAYIMRNICQISSAPRR